MKYDYCKNMCADVIEFMNVNKEYIDFEGCENLDELYSFVYDMIMDSDIINDRVSGEYEAEEYLCHNLDLLGDAMDRFGCGLECLMEQGAEACDVVIRSYLLPDVLDDEIWRLDDDYYAIHGREKEAV